MNRKYLKGSENLVADFLSLYTDDNITETNISTITMDELITAQANDATLHVKSSLIHQYTDGVMMDVSNGRNRILLM